jgi:hypothetical protein
MLGNILLAVAVLAIVAVVVYILFRGLSADLGSSDEDATVVADRILAESDAFRGSRSPEYSPWDGVNRLAPPTQGDL